MAGRVVLAISVASMLVVAVRANIGFPMVGHHPSFMGGFLGPSLGGVGPGFGPGFGGGFGGNIGGFGGGGGGYGGYGGYGGNYGGQGFGGGQGFAGGPGFNSEMLTCIAKDPNDLTSQMRLTLSSTRRGGFGGGYGGGYGGGMGGGFGNFGPFGNMGGYPGFGGDDFDMGDDFFDFDDIGDDLDEFRIDGTFIPSVAANKAGTYLVVVTTFGRTADGCSADALGPIYHRFGGGWGGSGGGFGNSFGGFGGYPQSPYQSPYGQNFWQGGQQTPLGQLSNPAIVGGSATIYSTHINGVSKNNLLGRGIALCRGINNGRCQGYIPYCCTIQRDSLSAMELFVTDRDEDEFDFGLGNGASGFPLGGNIASVGLGGINQGGSALGAGAATTGGLF